MAYKSSPRGDRPVSLVAIHTAEGARTAESLGEYFYREDIQASSHVGIDQNKVLQYVPYERSAWTLRSGNPISDNAELCGFAAWSRDTWLNQYGSMLRLAAQWARERCLARDIPMVALSSADVAIGHWGIIGHDDWTYGMHDGTHTDPGVTFPWDVFMEMVNEEGKDMDFTTRGIVKYPYKTTGDPMELSEALGFSTYITADMAKDDEGHVVSSNIKGSNRLSIPALRDDMDVLHRKVDELTEMIKTIATAGLPLQASGELTIRPKQG